MIHSWVQEIQLFKNFNQKLNLLLNAYADGVVTAIALPVLPYMRAKMAWG